MVETPIGVALASNSSNPVSTLDFGPITITSSGQTGTLSVEFTNQSGEQITNFALSFGTAAFTAAAPSLMTLTNGQTNTVLLTFTGPGDSASYLDTLQITGTIAGANFTQTVAVSVEMPSFGAAIAQELLEYESGAVTGTNSITAGTPIPFGNLLVAAAPTFTFGAVTTTFTLGGMSFSNGLWTGAIGSRRPARRSARSTSVGPSAP